MWANPYKTLDLNRKFAACTFNGFNCISPEAFEHSAGKRVA